MIVPFTETEKECLFPKKCPHFRCWAHFGAEVHWCDIQGKSEKIMQPADDTECVATVKYQFEEEEHIGEQYELDLGKLGKFVLRKGSRMEYETMMSKKGDCAMSKRAKKAAIERFPHFTAENLDEVMQARVHFITGYTQAEKDLGWHSVDECLPEIDEEVIVLRDEYNGRQLPEPSLMSFGHRLKDGEWNVPGVKYWMPCPHTPEDINIKE